MQCKCKPLYLGANLFYNRIWARLTRKNRQILFDVFTPKGLHLKAQGRERQRAHPGNLAKKGFYPEGVTSAQLKAGTPPRQTKVNGHFSITRWKSIFTKIGFNA